MRPVLYASLAALCALAITCAAQAQTNAYQVNPNAVLQIQRSHILDGVWRVGGFGELTITTRPNEVLEAQYHGRACLGQYRGNAFTLFCPSDRRGPLILSGAAVETAPVATTAMARIAAQPAELRGQLFQSYIDEHGHVEELGVLRATRQ